MKKHLLIISLLCFSFVFAACSPPEPDSEGQKTDLQGNALGNVQINPGTTESAIIPQVAVPDKKDAFSQPLSEQASKAGLQKEDVEAVRAKMAESFQMDLAEVQITAEAESNPQFMTGYVNVGEGEKGGIYFAAKTKEGWEVAYNGEGVVMCEPIEKYDFPVGMVPRCYDAVTGMTIDRVDK